MTALLNSMIAAMITPRMLAGAALGAAALLGFAATAHAQGAVYRCMDDNGRPQYTNVKTDTDGKRCTLVSREVSVVTGGAGTNGGTSGGTSAAPNAAASAPGAAPNAPRPAGSPPVANAGPNGFPRVDAQTQRSRDDSRRKILEDELAAEQRSLGKAKSDLAEQEGQRLGSEKNFQRYLDRVKPYQDTVDRHERNISALQKELGTTR